MKKTLTSLVSLGFIGAIVIGAINCGGTGGSGSGFGTQFVNTSCNPNTDCLELTTPSSMPVGTEDDFSARLIDGSGNPLAGIELCFEVEGGAGTIVEPPGGCGLTNSNGVVSGIVRANTEGSYQFTARAPSGFNLVSRNGIRFTEADLVIVLDCEPNVVTEGTPSECTATVTLGGVPVEDFTVNFSIQPTTTRASLNRTSDTTDSSGMATATVLTQDEGCNDGDETVSVIAQTGGEDDDDTVQITDDDPPCPPPAG